MANPELNDIPEFPVHFETDPTGFKPYKRDPQTLARPWAVPGTPGLEHRLGGLEKQDVTGNINYEPLNHEKMVRLRAAKVEAIAQDIPDVVPAGDPGRPADRRLGIHLWRDYSGDGTATRAWASHRACTSAAFESAAAQFGRCADALRQMLVPEMNMGQLVMLLRAKYLVDAQGLNKIQGRPFKQSEIEQKIEEFLD